LAAALVALAAIAVLLSSGVLDVQPATPVDVADAYMAAVNDRDFEAVTALFGPGIDTSLIEEKVGFEWWDFRAAAGEQFLSQGCHEVSNGDGGVLVDCGWTFDNAVMRVLGLEPATGQVSLLIADGHVKSLVDSSWSDGGRYEARATFNAWLEDNHPNDVATMMELIDSEPLLNSASIALWQQYTDEFVAEMEAQP
jgi:hypothetical protein